MFAGLKIIILAIIVCIFAASTAVHATIINIPDDYSTIQEGIDASSNGDTVLVQSGDYIENIDFDGNNIILGSLFLTTSDSSYILSTTIDGGSAGTVVKFENGEDNSAVLTGFTITNGNANDGGGISCINSSPTIDHNFIKGNRVNSNAQGKGGAIYCSNSSAIIKNCTVSSNSSRGNTGGVGGGLYLGNSDVVIFSSRFYGNSAQWSGGAIYMDQSNPTINNINLIHNSSTLVGGGIACYGSNPVITNVGFYNNSVTLNQGSAIYAGAGSEPDVTNSIVWGNGQTAVYTSNADVYFTYSDVQDNLWPGDGNISEDPLLRDIGSGDLHLMAIDCGDSDDSPCIDAGDPDIFENRMSCAWGLGTDRSDMGAYGGVWDTTTSVFDPPTTLPDRVTLTQNYPNPFNAATTIMYNLPDDGDVKLEVYNILGQKIGTLVDGYQSAGHQSVAWDANDYSSGIYFYKLTAGDEIIAKRMTLMK